jgi:hypothetical protein
VRSFQEDLIQARKEHAIAFRRLQLSNTHSSFDTDQLAQDLKAAYEASVKYLNLARKTYLEPNFDYYSVIEDFKNIVYLMGPLPIIPN